MKAILRLMAIILLILSIGCGKKEEKRSPSDFRGMIKARETDIPAKRTGYLKRFFCEEGDKVKLNEILFILDQRETLKGFELARALHSKSQKELKDLLAGYRKEDIAAQQEEVRKAAINVSFSQRNFERFKSLLERKVISEKELDDSTRILFVNKAELERTRSVLRKLKRGHRPTKISIAEAEVVTQRAKMAIWKERLSQTVSTSPIKGRVLARNYEIGEWVIESTPVLTIIDLRDIWAEIYILQTQLGKIFIDQKAEIKVDAFPEKTFEGKVLFISSKVETPSEIFQTRGEHLQFLFRVKIKVLNPEEKLRPGMTIKVTFEKEVS